MSSFHISEGGIHYSHRLRRRHETQLRGVGRVDCARTPSLRSVVDLLYILFLMLQATTFATNRQQIEVMEFEHWASEMSLR